MLGIINQNNQYKKYARWVRGVLLGFSFAMVFSSVQALGANTLDAREYQRFKEQEEFLKAQQLKSPDVHLQPDTAKRSVERLPISESPCFLMRRIALIGDDANEFQWALNAINSTATGEENKAIGRCLGGTGLNIVMARIQNAMAQRGFVTARVLIAPFNQNLQTGDVKLTLFAGRVGEIRIFDSGEDDRPVLRNALAIQKGDILNIRDIEQALENFKRVKSVAADIQIKPSSVNHPGVSDLEVKLARHRPYRMSLSLDDSGSKATGKFNAGATLSVDNLLTLSDVFFFNLSKGFGAYEGESGKGTNGYSVNYSFPIGYWQLGVSGGSSRYYQTVAGLSQSYIYSGINENVEAKLSRLIWRDAKRKITAFAAAWARKSKNFVDDTEVEVQRRQMGGWSVGVSHREFLSFATVESALTWRQGTGAFGAISAPEEMFGEGTSRAGVALLNAQITIPFDALEHSWRWSSELRSQFHQTLLIAQDKFSIGGRSSVRGFDGEYQLSAESGFLIRNELCLTLPPHAGELYLGADWGQVWGPSSQYLAGKDLSGAVIGWRSSYKTLNWDVFSGSAIQKPASMPAGTVVGFNLSLMI